jgi:hypothetical protein
VPAVGRDPSERDPQVARVYDEAPQLANT